MEFNCQESKIILRFEIKIRLKQQQSPGIECLWRMTSSIRYRIVLVQFGIDEFAK